MLLTTMSKGNENLGFVIVNEEIENALELYPDEPYKKAFANPELRQKLINYVMGGIQSIHPIHSKLQSSLAKTNFPYRSLELRLQVENYVHWGIEYLLERHSGRLERPIIR